jgi:hypothetical protein
VTVTGSSLSDAIQAVAARTVSRSIIGPWCSLDQQYAHRAGQRSVGMSMTWNGVFMIGYRREQSVNGDRAGEILSCATFPTAILYSPFSLFQ